MNYIDHCRANTAIRSLAKQWGKTPEETRQALVESYANLLKKATPIEKLQYFAIMKTEAPTAEDIVLLLAKDILPEEFEEEPANPLQEISSTWSTFQRIADKHNTTPEEVRKNIAECIDAAYATTDPKARAYWNRLFPNGKPNPEAFISRMAQEAKNRY